MKLLRIFLLIILTSVIFYSVFLFLTDLYKIDLIKITFNFNYIPLIFIFIIMSWIPLFFRWRLLCKNLKIDVRIRDDFLIYLGGFALSITPAKMGELIRTQILREKSGISRTYTTPLIFIEKFYDLIGALIVSILGIYYFPEITIIIISGVVLSIIIFVLFSSKYIFQQSTLFLSKFKFTKKFVEPLSQSHEILKSSTKPKIFISSLFLSTLYWILISFSVFYILKSLDVDSLGVLELISTYTSSLFLGAISFLPAGLGITEGSLTGLLHLQGISLSLSAVVVIIIRIFTLWFNVIVGFIALKIIGAFSINFTDQQKTD